MTTNSINIGDKLVFSELGVLTSESIEEKCGDKFRDEPYEIVRLSDEDGKKLVLTLIRGEAK